MINGKTIARLACVQALFLYEYEERTKNFRNIIDVMLSYYCDSAVSEDFRGNKIVIHKNYFLDLSNLTFKHLSLIDKRLEEMLHSDTELLSLSIIRVGACEILYKNSAPIKVVINEFTNISAAFDLNPSLVNSILDKLGGNIGQNIAEI